ncbi:MAG: DUF1902 domain-containing protein [Janthinobacterium lividum]
MERIINLTIERLPEGVWLATSDDVQGLVVQAGNLTDLLAWSREIAHDLIELQREFTDGAAAGRAVTDRMSLPVVIAA